VGSATAKARICESTSQFPTGVYRAYIEAACIMAFVGELHLDQQFSSAFSIHVALLDTENSASI